MYEINVALNGTHFFATHERSLVSMRDLTKVLPIFRLKFPESEGYTISVFKITTSSEQLGEDEITRII